VTVVLVSLAGAFIFIYGMRQAERSPNWPTQLGWVAVALYVPVAVVATRLATLLGSQVVVVR